MSVLLREYQTDAILAVERDFSKGEHPAACLATGLGKTTIFCALTERAVAREERVLILAHLDELVSQPLKRLYEQTGILASREQGDHEVDLSSAPSVVIGTRQTVSRRLDKYPPDYFHRIIVDEAHHAASAEYERIFSYFGGATRIGFTATPERSDKKGLAPWFTSIAFRLDTAQGIRDGWLASPTIRTLRLAGWSSDGLKKSGKGKASDYTDESLEMSFLAADLAAPVASAIIEQALTGQAPRPTIAFLPGVKASKLLTAELVSRGIAAEHVDASTPISERAGIFERFRSGETMVLSNCAILTEGFDAPNTSCVVACRPTLSRSLFTQCVGRGLRLAPNKTDCLVLDFTLEGSVSLSIDPHKALMGGEATEERERKERPSDLPPLEPQAMYPWANPEEAKGFSFEFNVSERVFFRGAFVAAHTLVSLVKGNPVPSSEESYTRTAQGFLDLVGIELTPFKYPPSEKQWGILTRILPAFKLDEVAPRVTGRTLDAVFQAEDARKKAGLCTLAQAWALWRFGFPPNVPKAFAKDLLSQVFEGREGDYRISPSQLEENVTKARGTMTELFAFASETLEKLRVPNDSKPDQTDSKEATNAEEDPWIALSEPL